MPSSTHADLARFAQRPSLSGDLPICASTVAEDRSPLLYRLPDGREVSINRDACRGASSITYTLEGDRVVTAVLCGGQR